MRLSEQKSPKNKITLYKTGKTGAFSPNFMGTAVFWLTYPLGRRHFYLRKNQESYARYDTSSWMSSINTPPETRTAILGLVSDRLSEAFPGNVFREPLS